MYEAGRSYSPLEQKLDSLTFNMSIEDLIKNHTSEMENKKKDILADVQKVVRQLNKPPPKPKVTGPRTSKTKHARDADLSTFQPISEKAAQAKDKHEKDQYDFYMKHRCNPAKILEVEILKKDQLKLRKSTLSSQFTNLGSLSIRR